MATTVPFEDEVLKLIFNGTPIAGIADNAAGTPATGYFVSLHTADPTLGPNANQSTAEVAYTAYVRMEVTRDVDGWTVSGGICKPNETIEFPVVAGVTAATEATHFGVGTVVSGNGKLMFIGRLNPPIPIANGSQPRVDNQQAASRFDETWA